ncbi:hypothetical protein GCM10011487_11310 [Steroidobacter agaridevorans]|uniref:Type I restriction modification DNA specificity domain-containing protein n=1 Tax=Steroidobacter agaridevorans TaxID=2695856 RepID=A0A829Y7Z6_9GAMM|nr:MULTISPECIES: restriction endonuclease subunit S [Steroidobacteraceae]GFE79131.1 hypothetical protein GCM10011487_11310 [Steroidobacter agaridevorans]
MVPEGWRAVPVSDICTLKNGHGFKPQEWDTKGLPIIRIQNLNGNENFNYFSGEPEKEWVVEPGQMLFAWAGTKGVSFGPTIWRGQTGVLNQHIFKVLPDTAVDEDWLFYCLRSVTERIERKAHGFKATLVHVRKSEIDNQIILCPPIGDQKRIAEILSTWDRAIGVTENLMKNSRAQKTALLQQLLTGKTRFPEHVRSRSFKNTAYGRIPSDWDFVHISDVAREVSSRNADDHDYPVVSCSKHRGFVNSLEYFKKQVFSENRTTYKIISRGQFGFPSNHIEEGSIGHQDLHDHALVSPIYCVFEASERINHRYLYSLLKTDRYRQLFSAATNGSVDRRGNLRWKEFSKIGVFLPSLEEQESITSAIGILDRNLRTKEALLAKLRQEKSALMQQLLTGKRRVKIDKEIAA